MSNRHGASIKIFLPSGSTEGIWVVELSNWTGRALVAPRSNIASLLDREEMLGAGVYVLIGPAESTSKANRIYVGEADVLKTRLKQQEAGKDFWTKVIVFTAGSASLNKARVKYLEARLIDLANSAGRSEVVNTAAPRPPSLSEADSAEVEGFLDEMLFIYPVLGLTAFEPLLDVKSMTQSVAVLCLKGPNTDATGIESAEGFVVFAGSKGRASSAPSVAPSTLTLRESLLTDGVLGLAGESILLNKDYLFSSPSSAASLLLGRASNGRVEWKTVEGVSLGEIQSDTLT